MATQRDITLPSTTEELQSQWLRDYRLAAIDAGISNPPVHPNSDAYLIGTATANLAAIGISALAIALDNSNLLTAKGDALERERIARGVAKVEPVGSSGKIRLSVDGTATIPANTELLLPNGLRIKTVSTTINPADKQEIDVVAIDTGSATNLAAGEVVRFVSTAGFPNVDETATVSASSPLTGGVDEESDDRKLTRILNKLQNAPGGGNWGHVRQISLEADASVQDVYSYPALGGPASHKVVPVRAIDPDQKQFSRACTAGQLKRVRDALFANLPVGVETVVSAAVDQSVDFAISVTIPDSALSGGNGQGWVDAAPWPPLVAGDSGNVAISAVANNGAQITVDAATTTAPVALQTHIAWWSNTDRKFRVSLVTGVSGATTAWVLTLQTAFVNDDGTACAIGEYISPAAVNTEGYGKAWLDLFNTFGPGQQTTDVNRIPRANRHPYTTREDPADWSDLYICVLQDLYPEITNAEREFASATTATVPGAVTTGPSLLVPRRFGIYKQ